MENTLQIFKSDVEKDLEEVGKCELDILILKKQIANSEIYKKNTAEIKRLNQVIENRLADAKDVLNKFKEVTGEKKIEVSRGGWVHFRAMPDKWTYKEEVAIPYIKEKYPKLTEKYIKVVETIKKAVIKKDIESKFISPVEGITREPQPDKFEYKLPLPGGGDLL